MALEPIVFETGPDATTVLNTALGALQSFGYTITPTDQWSGRAEVGSSSGRALGGGFSRRMIVDYRIAAGADQSSTQMVITPAMTGWSGGLMGVSKAKKEMESIWTTVGGALHSAGLMRQ